MKDRIRVIKFEKTMNVKRFLVEPKVERPGLGTFSIEVESRTIEIRPEYLLFSLEGEEAIPTVIIDDDYGVIEPERLLPIDIEVKE